MTGFSFFSSPESSSSSDIVTGFSSVVFASPCKIKYSHTKTSPCNIQQPLMLYNFEINVDIFFTFTQNIDCHLKVLVLIQMVLMSTHKLCFGMDQK